MKSLAPFALALLFPAMSLPAAESPVPVIEEPFHRTAFINDQLRVLDVQIPAGATTKYHIHHLPSVIVYLTKSTNRSQTWGESATSPRSTTPGDSRYAPYDQKSLTHQVTNSGAAAFRVFDIELLRPASGTSPVPLTRPNVRMHWEEPRARSYTLTLDPGGQSEFPSAQGHLLIGISGSVSASGGPGGPKTIGHGEFAFYPAKATYQLRNPGREKAELVLIELR